MIDCTTRDFPQTANFVSWVDFDDHTYIVWDVGNTQVIWKNDDSDANTTLPALGDWVDNSGNLTIELADTAARFQIFGLKIQFPKMNSVSDALRLETKLPEQHLLIQQSTNGEVIQRIEFESTSGDWAFASFSEDESTIAVIEPYFVTFFGKTDANR